MYLVEAVHTITLIRDIKEMIEEMIEEMEGFANLFEVVGDEGVGRLKVDVDDDREDIGEDRLERCHQTDLRIL